MKKIFMLSLVAGTIAFTAGAQNRVAHAKHPATTNWTNAASGVAHKGTGPVADTLVPGGFFAAANCNFTWYTVDTGYVTGNNKYGDKEKLMRYDLALYGYMLPTTVTGVGVLFGEKKVGANANVTAKVYAANGTGAPGTLLGTSVAKSVSSLDTTGALTFFTFTTPVNVTTTRFFVGVDVSLLNAAADSVAIVSTEDGCAAVNADNAWEKWSDNSFIRISDANSFGLDIDMAIFPALVSQPVSVANVAKTVFGASAYPVPANGSLNIRFTGAHNGNTTIALKDISGRVIMSRTVATVKGASYNEAMDVSALSSGMYFCEIASGTDKGVLKVSVQ